ncbi:probable ubiquitin-like-specific protease 2A [Dioscorea cayenensis subsp. rotundata]|uniref:Probable ubiquitin-like-specific protease 2A n=1 Tax=Dioscorea cayennensis subsp. rotundata TaxID=55577 RepID=A0AB40ARB5_DIOCR|nr:probable ubiquitin-like-specific protease 2A [Dioscorea cayenensis subsp. rotundata]
MAASPGENRVITRSHTRKAKEQLNNTEDRLSSFFYSLPRYGRSQKLRNSRPSHSNDEKKLDTNMFESYLEDLWNSISEEKRSSYTYLDCLWFSLHKKGLAKENVLKWIKKKQIFSRKYVFIPIVCWRHWSLLIFCNFGEKRPSNTKRPCMLLLDSLQQADPGKLEPDIRRFVLDIYGAEARKEKEAVISKIPLFIPKVPQQRNGEECGIFVLYFIYLFVQNAPTSFSLDGYPYFLKEDWFAPDDLESFRKKIHSFECSKNIESDTRQQRHLGGSDLYGLTPECREAVSSSESQNVVTKKEWALVPGSNGMIVDIQ